MKTFYDVTVEFVREETYTIQADTMSEAEIEAEKMAEFYASGQTVKITSVAPNLENPPF
jgi:hypothetical protein